MLALLPAVRKWGKQIYIYNVNLFHIHAEEGYFRTLQCSWRMARAFEINSFHMDQFHSFFFACTAGDYFYNLHFLKCGSHIAGSMLHKLAFSCVHLFFFYFFAQPHILSTVHLTHTGSYIMAVWMTSTAHFTNMPWSCHIYTSFPMCTSEAQCWEVVLWGCGHWTVAFVHVFCIDVPMRLRCCTCKVALYWAWKSSGTCLLFLASVWIKLSGKVYTQE